MKILFTSDWQMASGNLLQCNQVLADMLKIRADIVIHCGDFKEHYNPVDVRVMNMAVRVCRKFREKGTPFFVLLGNHDRVGMHNDAHNWFPALRAAGAITVSSPNTTTFPKKYGKKSSNDVLLNFLPYCHDYELLKTNSAALAKTAEAFHGRRVFMFHETIGGCKLNTMAKADNARVSATDFHPDVYDACIGGDIHLHQKIGKNIWYVGSPFPINWGEANQPKGFVLYDTDAKTVKFIPSSLPGLYDETWPGFKELAPKDWTGTGVRIHVSCEKTNSAYGQILKQAKDRAIQTYPGAEITVIPEFVNTAEQAGDIPFDADDTTKVKLYVARTAPAAISKAAAARYLTEQLAEATGDLRATGRLKFLGAKGENFLSYKSLELKFDRGICLVTGRNHDWLSRSNGAGKTSAMEPISVALFDRTFKGQRANSWARRGTTSTAFVEVTMQLPNGQVCTVRRQRRPTKVQVEIRGKDATVGNRKSVTDRQIEQLTGLTWKMLANAIYLDQRENLMLSGTNKDRKEVLEQFQNLERFTVAHKAVNDEIAKKTEEQQNAVLLKERLAAERRTLRELQKSDTTVIKDIGECNRIIAGITARLVRAKKTCEEQKVHSVAAMGKYRQELKELNDRIGKVGLAKMLARSDKTKAIQQLAKLKDSKICSACNQPIKQANVKSHITELREVISEKRAAAADYLNQELKLRKELPAIQARYDAHVLAVTNITAPLQKLESDLQLAQKELTWAVKLESDRKRRTERIQNLKVKITDADTTVQGAADRLRLLEYCLKTFSRNGLPAFLNAQLIPRLNKAAEHYSQLFADKQIQVLFSMEDGELDVAVVNPNGGPTLIDQSTGETRIASLITSFALREIATTSNVLILDEPGEGLDSHNAKVFATGLKSIADRFDTILITTHNQTLLGELSGERRIEAVKRHGISKLKAVAA